jgi:hypothetical protein
MSDAALEPTLDARPDAVARAEGGIHLGVRLQGLVCPRVLADREKHIAARLAHIEANPIIRRRAAAVIAADLLKHFA